MHVLHINATSHTGGAARAMRRLHSALVEKGHQSQFLVGRSIAPEDPLVHLIWEEIARYETLINRIQSRIGNQFSRYYGINPWSSRPALRVSETAPYDWADIIDLRNLFGGFFNLWSLPRLSKNKPVVWRMPDLWAVTGHCAYPYNCSRWKMGCHHCPLLTEEGRRLVEPSPTILDGTRRIWRAKKKIYQQSNIHIIVTTEWMRDQVRQSILGESLSINVISNGVNLDVFNPVPKREARKKLGLNPDGKYLLWAAGGRGNRRKGYHLAVEALEGLQANGELDATFLTMGGKEGWDKPDNLKRVKHYGYVREAHQQALIFSAADAFLCTTLADGQPQTALESLACGTPVISFDVGPMPEIVQEGITGVIASDLSANSLASVIQNHLLVEDKLADLRGKCREYAETHFDLREQTNQYVLLYEKILRRSEQQ